MVGFADGFGCGDLVVVRNIELVVECEVCRLVGFGKIY